MYIRVWTYKKLPSLTLIGEIWGVFCEDLGENQPCYSGPTLYVQNQYWNGYETVGSTTMHKIISDHFSLIR